MHTKSIRHAFRQAGKPVVSLALLCMMLGSIALAFDPGAALTLFTAGIGALVVFVLMADVVIPPPATQRDPVRPVDRRRRHG